MSPPTQAKREKQAKAKAKAKAKVKAEARAAAKANMVDRPVETKAARHLPDAVLLQILKDVRDRNTLQAAYRSCKYIRDLGNHYMKSVTVDICSANTLYAVRAVSSSTMCPVAAYGIEELILRIEHPEESITTDHAYEYLEQLINNAFSTSSTHCRREQLANVARLKILLPKDDQESTIPLTRQHVETISHLLQHFPKLQALQTDCSDALLSVSLACLKHVILKQPLTARQLNAIASMNPSIQMLECVLTTNVFSYLGGQLPLQFTALEHLTISERWFTLTRGMLSDLTQLSTLVLDKVTVAAGALTDLKQLTSLTLHTVDVEDVHMLTSLNITHLTLGSLRVRKEELLKQQQLPAEWPALKSIKFLDVLYGASLDEDLARALLPLPHAGLIVDWPSKLRYCVDTEPHPLFKYMGVAHMKSFKELILSGQHVKLALQEIVHKQIKVEQLYVWGSTVHKWPLDLASKDIATHLKIASVTTMSLDTLVTGTPELFSEIFLQCPKLGSLSVNRSCCQLKLKTLSQSLRPLSIKCSDNSFYIWMLREVQ